MCRDGSCNEKSKKGRAFVLCSQNKLLERELMQIALGNISVQKVESSQLRGKFLGFLVNYAFHCLDSPLA